jgi:hypothetical protein
MSNRVGLREDQRMGHGLAVQIMGWLTLERHAPHSLVWLTDDVACTSAPAGKPGCYGFEERPPDSCTTPHP